MTSVPAALAKPASSKLMTQQKIDRKIKSGRGKGVRESYEPWIKVWEIKSKGVSHLVPGVKFQRTHHLLSLVIFCPDAALLPLLSTICQQHKAARSRRAATRAIASSLNVWPPVYPGTSVTLVLTTDFLSGAMLVILRSSFDGWPQIDENARWASLRIAPLECLGHRCDRPA